MEIGNKRHVFVINNAKVNKLGQVVFYVSSKNIDPNNTNKVIKKLKKIPQGPFHNARFDIDSISTWTWTWTNNPNGNTGSPYFCQKCIYYYCSNANDYTTCPDCSDVCNNYYQ
jgi:hypothetical protein